MTSAVEEFNGYADEEEMLGIAASSNYNGSEFLQRLPQNLCLCGATRMTC